MTEIGFVNNRKIIDYSLTLNRRLRSQLPTPNATQYSSNPLRCIGSITHNRFSLLHLPQGKGILFLWVVCVLLGTKNVPRICLHILGLGIPFRFKIFIVTSVEVKVRFYLLN